MKIRWPMLDCRYKTTRQGVLIREAKEDMKAPRVIGYPASIEEEKDEDT